MSSNPSRRSREVALPRPSNTPQTIARAARECLKHIALVKKVRLIGVRLSGLVPLDRRRGPKRSPLRPPRIDPRQSVHHHEGYPAPPNVLSDCTEKCWLPMATDIDASTDAQQRSIFEPAYLRLLRSGELADRARRSRQHLEDCDFCARYCRVDRRQSIRGAICRTGERAVVYSAGPHHGEEACLRGWRGSGTIFFSWCNLRCIFCQNWEISWLGEGQEASDEELAEMMLRLQALGCHNINLVTPSHVVAQILGAVKIAAEQGLCLPLVYNTSGYDTDSPGAC